jgi:hypothetical protein
MIERTRRVFNYRGSFACVGSDDVIHTIEAMLNENGDLVLVLEDGRSVKRLVKGRYIVVASSVHLFCDHPDAP